MKTTRNDKVEALLDAHVAFVLAQTRGEALTAWLENEIECLLADAGKVRLEEAVTREMIKATTHGYAVELELAGAIPELVGDILRAIYVHESQTRTSLHDLVSDRVFKQFVDKLLELHELREWLVHELVAQPAYAALATDVIVGGLRGFLEARTARASRATAFVRSTRVGERVSEVATRFEESIEESLRAYVQKNLEALLLRSETFLSEHFDEERAREFALGLWEELQERQVASALDKVSTTDIEEIFVIAYEAWRELRVTDYYRVMIDAGIDGFFEKYGDVSLSDLLDELGITREIMRREAVRFAPPVLAMLEEKKLLEPYVRRHLEGFYRSDAVAAILADDAGA